ncbi:hypothetical protein MKK75_10175 [Methylobacterium sp. J-030]|uniref:HNH endonuclease n=1 Tax=Methylobacterium sp. J-030 TaxID=2836627 RepID=UPI001FB8E4F9|nr:hypothetical protein [Methylobacterium sp. J-030]MCJ2069165.1 hypothetical protein [Methylobacterium sp. J-030]
MPISAANQKLYPGGSIRSPEWRAIRDTILKRARFHCEGTSRVFECRAVHGDPHPETGKRVVLTIAHLDHDPRHNDPGNLRALCQRCHNRWDKSHRTANARATRQRKAIQLGLFDQSAGGRP